MYPNYTDAHTITFEVADSSSEITRYDAVKLTGDMEVAITDTAGEQFFGIAATDEDEAADPTKGKTVSVRLKGMGNARVAAEYDDNGDGAANTATAAPATLVPSGTEGVLRPLGAEDAAEGIDARLTGAPGDDGLGSVYIR